METTNRPLWFPVDEEKIPPELKELPGAVWKAAPRPGGGYAKAPCNPVTGRKVGANDPKQWGTFSEALAAYKAGGWDGIGVLLMQDYGLVGIDVDDAKMTTEANRDLKAVLAAYLKKGGYLERSPSGNGLRGFILGTLPVRGPRRVGKVEIYNNARFLTLTGAGQGQILADQGLIDAYCSAMGGGKPGAVSAPIPIGSTPELAANPAVVSQLTATMKAAEPDLWAGKWAASGHYPSQSEADQAFANKIVRQAQAAGIVQAEMFSTVEQVFSASGLGQREKWTQREDYRQRTITKALSSTPTVPQSDTAVESAEAASPSVLQEFLDRYFVATAGKKTWIFDRTAPDVIGSALNVKSFTELHANRFHGGNPVVSAFMKSPKRVTYAGGVVFNPQGVERPTEFNVWQGFAVKPKVGGYRRVLRHIRDVLCSSNSKQFKYLVRWMALLVQQPWVKPEVAIVLRSVEGTGKSIIAGMLTDIFGLHGFTASQSNQVVGQFNGHLYDKVMVVLEEAFFAGDPRSESQAKVLITNRTMAYEWKFMGAESRLSYHHVWLLTNRDWAVPVGADSRRYAVLDVSAHRKGDYPYFKVLADEIEHGGLAAFLSFLLRVNLSGYNPRQLPNTKTMASQKAETLRHTCSEQAWWLEALVAGEMPLADGGATPFGHPIPGSELQAAYEHFAKGMRNAKRWPRAVQDLRKVMPVAGLVKRRPSNGGMRYHEYVLPDLAAARAAFCAATGVEIDP